MSQLLPRMASEETQKSWTGSAGVTLLRQTLIFTRILSCSYADITGAQLAGSKILDFGVGYGRLLRLMYYFSDPGDLYGCDPWDRSIELCKSDGVLGHLAQSDYLPVELPFGDQAFHLIYCFSVFTHLSPRACKAAFSALRRRIRPDGLLVITIRPFEYWAYAKEQGSISDAAALEKAHNDFGYAFAPHAREAIDGDITFGDASVTLDYLRSIPDWQLLRWDRSIADAYQVIVFLRPA